MLNPTNLDEQITKHLSDVARLRRFTGAPAEFWPAFITAASGVAGAARGMLILKDQKDGSWKKLSEWSDGSHADRTTLAFNRQLIDLGERAAREGNSSHVLEQAATPDLKHYGAAVRLALNRPEDTCIAVFLLSNITDQAAKEALLRLQLTADTPFSYLMNHAASTAKTDVEKFAASLDVMTLLNAEKKFLGATLALCNAVASRYSCDRVSLGWIENGYIRLKTISRTEKFDKHMAAVKALELMMEEAFDQDDEIIFPQPDGTTYVSRDHEKFAKENSSGNVISLPVRVDGSAVAVLTCERQGRPFTAPEAQQLRLACDQSARRLADLKEQEGWAGARAGRSLRKALGKVVGPEHTWIKVIAVLAAVILAILFFVPVNYRVPGNFILKTDDVSYLTAPFDGFIKSVGVRPGEQIKNNAVMLEMDTNELGLEEAAALADQVRFLRESEKARATNGLADSMIAKSMADQAKARLDLVRYKIAQSGIKAPFDGIIIEGDLRERVGSPVKQGDALFKVTKLQSVWVEAQIDQRDIHHIKPNAKGQIAFVTRPNLKYPFQVERIYPAAMPKDGENIYTVRGKLLVSADQWWRPGMTGKAKIDAGQRTLIWILTHRTVDFLRMHLWLL